MPLFELKWKIYVAEKQRQWFEGFQKRQIQRIAGTVK